MYVILLRVEYFFCAFRANDGCANLYYIPRKIELRILGPHSLCDCESELFMLSVVMQFT